MVSRAWILAWRTAPRRRWREAGRLAQGKGRQAESPTSSERRPLRMAERKGAESQRPSVHSTSARKRLASSADGAGLILDVHRSTLDATGLSRGQLRWQPQDIWNSSAFSGHFWPVVCDFFSQRIEAAHQGSCLDRCGQSDVYKRQVDCRWTRPQYVARRAAGLAVSACPRSLLNLGSALIVGTFFAPLKSPPPVYGRRRGVMLKR